MPSHASQSRTGRGPTETAYEKHGRQLKRLQAFHDVLYPLFLRLQARFDKEGEYAEYICDQNKDF